MDEIEQLIQLVNLRALDIGARGGIPDTWNNTAIPLKVTRFDMEGCNIYKSKNKLITEKYMPMILSGKSGWRSMYILKGESGSSLFKPNQKWEKFWIKGYTEISRIENVKTKAIRDLDLSSFQLVKADIQGAELEVFEGIGEEKWNDLVGIEVEVSFCDTYENICLFPDIHTYLESKDFSLIGLRPSYRFLKSSGSQLPKYKLMYGNIADHTIMGKTNQADCLYLKITNLESYGISQIVRYLNICTIYRYADGIELMRISANKRIRENTLTKLCDYFSEQLRENIKNEVAGIHCGATGF